jgi:hypothetical protein
MVSPAGRWLLYYNYTHLFPYHASYSFVSIDTEAYGKNSDSSVFQNSVLRNKTAGNEISFQNIAI